MKIQEFNREGWKIEFFYSPFFEMLCSLHVLTHREHHMGRLSWANEMEQKLEPGLYKRLIAYGTDFFDWCSAMDFCELAGEMNEFNLTSALDYLEQLDIVTFINILLGRRIPTEKIKEFIIRKKADNSVTITKQQGRIFEGPERFRREFVASLREYFYIYFEKELRFIEPLLVRSLKRQADICSRMNLFEYIKTLHTRIEIGEDAFLFHKYTKFTLPFNKLQKITINASSFIDPHLLIGVDTPGTLQLTVRVGLQEAASQIPEDLYKTMKALGDQTRLKILKALYRRKSSTQSLAKELELTEACISKHLKYMHDAEIVFKEREGNYIYYMLDKMVVDRIPMDIYQYLDG